MEFLVRCRGVWSAFGTRLESLESIWGEFGRVWRGLGVRLEMGELVWSAFEARVWRVWSTFGARVGERLEPFGMHAREGLRGGGRGLRARRNQMQ